MLSSQSLLYSNCEIRSIKFAHKWVIPDFGSWISKNPDQWLNGPSFSPAQGIRLQLKILGSKPDGRNSVQIFLINKHQKRIYFIKSSMSFYAWETRPFSYSTEENSNYELVISDEFEVEWKEMIRGVLTLPKSTWNPLTNNIPKELEARSTGNIITIPNKFAFEYRTSPDFNESSPVWRMVCISYCCPYDVIKYEHILVFPNRILVFPNRMLVARIHIFEYDVF